MTHDEWRLLRYGILIAFLMALVLVPILLNNINFPKSVAEGILGAIALAVFLLSKYMERPRNQTDPPPGYEQVQNRSAHHGETIGR